MATATATKKSRSKKAQVETTGEVIDQIVPDVDVTADSDITADPETRTDKWEDKKLVRMAPWTRAALGSVESFPKGTLVSEAGRSLGLDFDLRVEPLLVDIDGELHRTGKSALVRPAFMGQPVTVVGTAGEKYEPVQNMDLFKLLDPVVEKYPLESIGVMPNGDGIFITLNAGKFEVVKGEEITEHIIIRHVQNGGSALLAMFSGMRLACWNALNAAIAQASIRARILHTKGATARTGDAVALMTDFAIAKERTQRVYQQLAMTKIVEEQVDAIIAAAFPLPKPGHNASLIEGIAEDVMANAPVGLRDRAENDRVRYEYAKGRMLEFRSTTKALFNRIEDEHPVIAGTAWAAVNAVAEASDYRRGASIESVSVSTMFGSRAQEKTRAFEEALAIIARS